MSLVFLLMSRSVNLQPVSCSPNCLADTHEMLKIRCVTLLSEGASNDCCRMFLVMCSVPSRLAVTCADISHCLTENAVICADKQARNASLARWAGPSHLADVATVTPNFRGVFFSCSRILQQTQYFSAPNLPFLSITRTTSAMHDVQNVYRWPYSALQQRPDFLRFPRSHPILRDIDPDVNTGVRRVGASFFVPGTFILPRRCDDLDISSNSYPYLKQWC